LYAAYYQAVKATPINLVMASPAILTAIYVARDEAPHAFDQLKKLTTPTITPDEALAWWESQTVDGTFFKTYVRA
jgi:hypothetical protein